MENLLFLYSTWNYTNTAAWHVVEANLRRAPAMTINELTEQSSLPFYGFTGKKILCCLFFHPASQANLEQEHLQAFTLLTLF